MVGAFRRVYLGDFILLWECIMLKSASIKEPKQFNCKKCDYNCIKESEWDRHIDTTKHRIRTNVQKAVVKQPIVCLTCNFTCKRNCDLVRHNVSAMHKKRVLIKENEENTSEKDTELEKSKYVCPNCDKVYSGRSSLWYHKKKCIAIEKPIEQQNYESCLSIIQKDSDFKTFLIEQNKQLMKYIMEHNELNNALALKPDINL
jgi:hypothetical protein